MRNGVLSHKAWHIPYTQEAFEKLKLLFPEIVVDKLEEEVIVTAEIRKTEITLPQVSPILVEVTSPFGS